MQCKKIPVDYTQSCAKAIINQQIETNLIETNKVAQKILACINHKMNNIKVTAINERVKLITNKSFFRVFLIAQTITLGPEGTSQKGGSIQSTRRSTKLALQP